MPNVKIKGYSGMELPFSDVPKVWLAAPESTPDNPVLVPFTYGEAIEGVEVEPDFSDGDMQITAPDGYLIRSGVVKKPETLVPENIAKDVEVAGIVGEFEGGSAETENVTFPADFSVGNMLILPSDGKLLESVTVEKPETLIPDNVAMGVTIAGIVGSLSGAAEIKAATGQTTTTYSATATITHGLGVVPDIIIIYYTASANNNRVYYSFGISKKLAQKSNVTGYLKFAFGYYGSTFTQNHREEGIEESIAGAGNIFNANEDTFSISLTSSFQLYRYSNWLAIGGLA